MNLKRFLPIFMFGCLPILGDCNLGSGPPASPPTSAVFEIDLSDGPFGPLPNCEPSTKGIIRMTPIQLTAGSGTDSMFTSSVELFAGGPFHGTNYCTYSEGPVTNKFSLHPGRWQVEVTFGTFSTSCEIQLEAGLNNIKFAFNVYGKCTPGLQPYPTN